MTAPASSPVAAQTLPPAWSLLLRATRVIPPWLAWRAGAQLGWWFGHLPMRDQLRARAGLLRAFPERGRAWAERTACAAFRHFGRMALWTLATLQHDPRALMARIAIEGRENLALLRAACRRGEGTVGYTGHVGNWELLARMSNLLAPTTMVARRLRDPRANAAVQGARTATGSRLVYQEQDVRSLVRELRSGRLLTILADQDVPRLSGVHVPWFGIPAHTPVAPAALTLLSGGGAIPVFLYERAGRWVLHVGPRRVFARGPDRERDILAITTWATSYQEALVRRRPAQWVWWHLRWRTPPAAGGASSPTPSGS
jgi:KDO2-lipid IV(A) lauroyltransferase